MNYDTYIEQLYHPENFQSHELECEVQPSEKNCICEEIYFAKIDEILNK